MSKNPKLPASASEVSFQYLNKVQITLEILRYQFRGYLKFQQILTKGLFTCRMIMIRVVFNLEN